MGGRTHDLRTKQSNCDHLANHYLTTQSGLLAGPFESEIRRSRLSGGGLPFPNPLRTT